MPGLITNLIESSSRIGTDTGTTHFSTMEVLISFKDYKSVLLIFIIYNTNTKLITDARCRWALYSSAGMDALPAFLWLLGQCDYWPVAWGSARL